MSDASGPLVAFIVIGAAVIGVLRLVSVLNGASGSSKRPASEEASIGRARAKHYAFAHQFLQSVLEHDGGPRYFTLEKSLANAMLCVGPTTFT